MWPDASPHIGRARLECKRRDRFVERHDLCCGWSAQHAQRDLAFLGLALADDEQVRNLGQAECSRTL
jgi:hypothetical protein